MGYRAAAMTDSQTPLAQLDITLEHATVVNFALQHIDVPLVRRIVIVNRGERDVGPLSLHIAIEPPVAPPLRHDILESLRPGETLAIDDRVLVMRLSAERLARQLTTDHGTLTVTVATPDATRTETRPVAIHAFNAWLRDVHPESLACFVEPGHPALLPLLQAAQEELGRTTGDSALDGYQSGSERARLIARALWRALQSAGVGYVEAPARSAGDGETVRPPDRTLIDHMGTSLDLSVLYAALLEQAGLHPVLVVARDRVTPGCFLVERERLSAATSDDLTEVTKRLADGGRGSLLLVDAAACTKAGTTFEVAESAAAAGLERARYELTIDVSQARRDGVRPLPLVRDRRDEPLAAVEAPLAPGLAPTAPASAPEAARMADVRPVVAEATPLERRLESWKSQLLDLSLRNPLLAFKWEGKRCLPIAGHDIARLEDGLASREPFALAPHEDGQRSRVQLERRTGARAADPRLATLLAEGKIEVDLAQAELEKRLTELYRQSRSVTEESGSTALWLALGFVEWVDDKALPAEQKPLYAPIILLPVEIVRAAARDPFRLRLAEDEARINSTLLAKLASQFRADVAGYDDLPEDDAGLDVPLILERFRQLVKPIPKCQVVDRAAVAMFSFAKYLMWLDLEARTDALLANPVVRHLLGGADRAFPLATPFVARAELDRRRPPADDLSVVEADSSQLVAVQAAVDGDTFVLEGPPGTGKSQTITNLVAEAMGRGKSVLFVAEKRAAVDVVQRRLEAVGLGRFVLDLHAPDQTKAEIVAALAANLDLKGDGDAGALAATGAALQKVRDQLAAVWRELHAPGAAGMSAWQAVSRLGDLGAAPILSHSFAGSGDGQGAFDSERAARVREAVHALGHASRSVAPMASHPFAGAAIHSWDARAQSDVGAALEAARARVEETRRLGSEVADLLGLELAPETAEALRLLTALAAELGRAPRRTATFVGDRRHESELQPVIETVALSEQRRRRWSELEPRWKPGSWRSTSSRWRRSSRAGRAPSSSSPSSRCSSRAGAWPRWRAASSAIARRWRATSARRWRCARTIAASPSASARCPRCSARARPRRSPRASRRRGRSSARGASWRSSPAPSISARCWARSSRASSRRARPRWRRRRAAWTRRWPTWRGA
ncbi:MAG: DUF4011 domain-containing protein [Myxococcota bacterium]